MENNRKIYIVGGGRGYANWMQGTVVPTMEEADLVVFTGGEDVDPSLYGEEKHKYTTSNVHRDAKEIEAFQKAQELGKHIIGICRGAQFSCVMSEGRLVQHQDNPYYTHPIQVKGRDGEIIITSTHHQAMYPYDMPHDEYKLLGWTRDISRMHQNGRGEEMLFNGLPEAEIVYFPKTKALGIQGHPEMMDEKKYPETFEYLRGLLNDHLSDKL
jgi:gamma-glutamyl-gamma-aminobutyrate hydrolase PuuD